jgi:glycosyltransferase involved in cell wall biosynthesis
MEKPHLTIILSTHYSLDGAEICGYLERFETLFFEYGKHFKVVVFSSDSKNYSVQLGIQHRSLNMKKKIFVLWHFVYYLWLVVQANNMKGVIKVFGSNIPTLPLIKLISKRPLIVTYEWEYGDKVMKDERNIVRRFFAYPMEYLAIISANLVLVTTKRLEMIVTRRFHKKTGVIPNWVDMRSVLPGLNSIQRSDNLILYAGRLVTIKGVDILIKSFARIKKLFPDLQLMICGSGEQEKNLIALAASLCIEDIVFKGAIPNKQLLELMQSAAIFVLPTITVEGHPRSLIEAMACGCACIATDVLGNNDVIQNQLNGLLVPPNDIGALEKGILKLLQNKELRKKLGSRAQMDVGKLSINRVVGQEIEYLLPLANAH